MYSYKDNLFVPDYDLHCLSAIRSQMSDMHRAVKLCKKREVCVQAGGNFGAWPRELAKLFGLVYTFEPDAMNFACLAWNTRDNLNVHRFQAALGERRDWCGLKSFADQHNAGAHQVEGDGNIPVMCVDDFKLGACDLIYLDIEGSEPAAIFGARNTIGLYHPVIAIEEKGLSDCDRLEQALAMLRRQGYHLVDQVNNDKIFAC